MKKPCANCKRDKSIVAGGHCFLCYKAAKGKSGDELISALTEIKRKIDNGEVNRGGRRERPRKNSASPPALPIKGRVIIGKLGKGGSRGLLLEATEEQTIIPVTLRLTVEIAVRVNGIVS